MRVQIESEKNRLHVALRNLESLLPELDGRVASLYHDSPAQALRDLEEQLFQLAGTGRFFWPANRGRFPTPREPVATPIASIEAAWRILQQAGRAPLPKVIEEIKAALSILDEFESMLPAGSWLTSLAREARQALRHIAADARLINQFEPGNLLEALQAVRDFLNHCRDQPPAYVLAYLGGDAGKRISDILLFFDKMNNGGIARLLASIQAAERMLYEAAREAREQAQSGGIFTQLWRWYQNRRRGS